MRASFDTDDAPKALGFDAAGTIRSTAATTLSPLTPEAVREAHRLSESGQVIGKVVITAE